ncbi:MAG: hypothetical protein JWP27_1540 [Flaviaesturariibacter sp.]|nr:hypothetical protein [Flaviaesturariibacter sp.]
MPGEITNLTESMMQKSFADCSIPELEDLTDRYPYFAPAHFLLLKKYDPASEEYRRQYQKAILYFHDPLSFDALLSRPFPDITLDEAPETEDEQIAGEILDVTLPEAAPLPPIEHAAPADTELTFEPFHTVDYFASQGIKLSAEVAPGDTFGKQVKSFTDWLKTMKRLPATAAAKPIDTVAEKKVENMADHSVQEAEIVTESMAEVWLKQGNRQKAVEVYRKLSLLNPSKRAYFADKIQNLNG